MTEGNPSKINSKSQAQAFLDSFDTFLFDCDGVLWLGKELLPRVKETLQLLEKLGKQTIFVTNNSTKSRAAYCKKFASFGLEVTQDQIFSSAYSSAIYVKEFLKLKPGVDKIWICGEAGIAEELALMGYESIGGTDPHLDAPFDPEKSPFLVNGLDPAVRCVIAGLDSKINYHRLAVSLQYLQNPDVHFLGTNVDSTYPQKGYIFPGAGSVINSLAYASGRAPIYCGKPNQIMLDSIISVTHLDISRSCMVGDRLNTDVRFGVEGRLAGTLLVLTGIETEQRALEESPNHPKPKYYIEKLGDIYDYLQ